jgi:hypothetical protein
MSIGSAITTIPFGRRLLHVAGRRVLQCRCDAATLIVPLPAPVNVSYCELCGVKRPQKSAQV